MDIINVKVLKLNKDAALPEYKTIGSSGFDLRSTEEWLLAPGETHIFKTGLAFEVPLGYEMQIRPRSGLSSKTKVRVPNTPGTVDSDYRGEVGIILENIGDTPITINKGDRIAQGVIQRVEKANFIKVDTLTDTERGDGGYGSTGIK